MNSLEKMYVRDDIETKQYRIECVREYVRALEKQLDVLRTAEYSLFQVRGTLGETDDCMTNGMDDLISVCLTKIKEYLVEIDSLEGDIEELEEDM